VFFFLIIFGRKRKVSKIYILENKNPSNISVNFLNIKKSYNFLKVKKITYKSLRKNLVYFSKCFVVKCLKKLSCVDNLWDKLSCLSKMYQNILWQYIL